MADFKSKGACDAQKAMTTGDMAAAAKYQAIVAGMQQGACTMCMFEVLASCGGLPGGGGGGFPQPTMPTMPTMPTVGTVGTTPPGGCTDCYTRFGANGGCDVMKRLEAAMAGAATGGVPTDAMKQDAARMQYASWAVRFQPDGGQFDFVRSPARTPHGGASYVQMS